MRSNYQSITDFAREIERREAAKRDYIVPSGMMVMQSPDVVELSNTERLKANSVFHGQLASKLDIPKRYYDRIAEVPGLREANVNMILHSDDMMKKNHLVRSLDGYARAFLSDRFKPMDHFFFLNALLPILMEIKGVQIFSNSITDSRMYLQVVFTSMEAEIKKGDPIRWGISLSNSEVGMSAITIEQFIARLVCMNGAVGESLVRKTHVGRQITEEDISGGLFKEDTIEAEMKALSLKFRDIVTNHLTDANFKAYVDRMKEARGMEIDNLPRVIEEVTRRYSLSQSDGAIMLTNISKEGEVNKYGLMNSVTYLAQQVEDFDRQYELEKLGTKILSMNNAEWSQLNAA